MIETGKKSNNFYYILQLFYNFFTKYTFLYIFYYILQLF